jgi:putative ABC transport system permease protein
MIIWDKVWADLWSNKVRTILAVLSIAAGVFAIGAIFGMADQMLSGMDRAHQAVFPSHINMYLMDDIDRKMADSIEKIAGVEAVELLNTATVRYKVDPEQEWERADMVAREDYDGQTYDVVQLKEGDWPSKDLIAIERLSAQYYGIETDDEVLFELEGTDRPMRVAGKIRHPFVPPPQFGGNAYFFASGEGLERFGVEQGRYSQLLARVEPYSLAYAQEVASEMKDRLAREGVGVAVTFYQDPQKHWGRLFVEGITVVMQVLAVVSLFTSVILVLNTLTALITQQTNQIGIVKAIGGSTTTILKTYLVEVAIFGLLALLVSLPLGLSTAFFMTQGFLNLFNIDYDVFRFSDRALVYQVLAAVAAPLVAALWPVMRGATITVREAIASYGLGGGGFGSGWLDRAVEKVGSGLLPSLYALALSNVFRHKGRLALTLGVLITAGTMFLAIMSLSTSLNFTVENEFQRRDYDLAISFEERERIDQMLAVAQSVHGVERAEMWFNQPVTVLLAGQRTQEAGLGSYIYGIPGAGMYEPLIVSGRWLRPEDENRHVVVMNRETAEENDVEVGDVVTLDLGLLGKDDWRVVGLYQVIFGGGFTFDAIYGPQEAVFRATKKYNQASQLYVRTRFHDEDYVAAVTNQLKDVYKARNKDVYYTQATYEDREAAAGQFGIALNMLLALAVIVALVGGIGLMGSLSISVVERTREIGVMRAIGAVSGRLLSMLVMEGLLQGLLSWALSVPLSFVLSRPMANVLGRTMFDANLDFRYNFRAILVWLGIVLVVSTLASILPARNATVISVRESLAYE